jgi:hypothetical protein
MKLIDSIKARLPVSRRAHEQALVNTRREALGDSEWLLDQLDQAKRTNLRLEREAAERESR